MRVSRVLLPALALATAVAASSATGALAAPLPTGQLQAIERIYTEGMRGGQGGSFGFYLQQVGGPQLIARNASFAYDPSDAIDTLYLANALHEVQSGADALVDGVDEYAYPHSKDAEGDPTRAGLCPDAADEVAANRVTPPPTLGAVLEDMMQSADNRAARAIELRYGRVALNAFAASLGMKGTKLEQIIGCGAEGTHQNEWTLLDAGLLYDRIASGSLLSPAMRQRLYEDMSGPSPVVVGSLLAAVLEPEARALGVPEVIGPFAAALSAHLMAGSADLCASSCSAPGGDSITRDEAGILTVPFDTESGQLMPTDFVLGSFITGERIQCPPQCALGDQAEAAMQAGMPELLRVTLRAALESWAARTRMVAATGVRAGQTLRLRATLANVYGGLRPSGQAIEFSLGGEPVCTATTERYGGASCSGPLPPGAAARLVVCPSGPVGAHCRTAAVPATYEASFAGAEDLFATSATGALVTRTPPVLSGASLSARRWRLGPALLRVNGRPAGGVRVPPVGTELRFSLNEPAAVRLTFKRLVRGREVAGICRIRRGFRGGSGSCLRAITAGQLSFSARAGANHAVFQGRLSRRARLRPGRYTVDLIATSAGEVTPTRTLAFTLLP